MKKFILIFTFFAWAANISAHPPDSAFDKKQFKIVTITAAGLYVVSMTGLYQLWYKDYDQTTFHFFNDNNEWLGMDKVGHLTTSYYLGLLGHKALLSTGISPKKALWLGGSSGLLYLTTIEIFDGFSKGWGFSWGDEMVNILGSGLYLGQQLAWNEQRATLKFSFHQTRFAQYRKDLFGSELQQNMLKDYNGQTYWLSTNLASFSHGSTFLPKWLNFAIGYSLDGFTGASMNPEKNPKGEILPKFERTNQFLFSFDVDFNRIPVKSKTWKNIFAAIGFIKVPFPAFELRPGSKPIWHAFYF